MAAHDSPALPLKTKISFCIIFLVASLTARAQTGNLRISLVDEKSVPFQNATAYLYRLPDSAVVKKQVIRQDSVLQLQLNKDYLLKITSTGMQDLYRNISLSSADTLITLVLQHSISNLGNVTIIAKRPLIRQDDDKTVVDAEVLANSSSNAYEVLEKTPGAILDQDGNVYLNSTIPATVFINGREMKLSSADIASLLKSLPAGSISKIEILRTPSAKYDASGSGGIINIVLKKGVRIGTSGSVNAASFQGVYNTLTAGFNLNKGSGKLNSYLSYQVTRRNNFEDLASDRFFSPDTSLLSQQSYTTYPYLNHYGSAGADYAFSKKFNLGYDFRVNYADGESSALNDIRISNSHTGILTGTNRSAINNTNNNTFTGNSINAKLKIDSLGSEWTTSLEHNYYQNNNSQYYRNLTFFPVVKSVTGDGENRNRKNIFVIQTDLTLKLPRKYTLETGLKLTLSNSENSSLYYKDTGNNIRLPDVYQTNTFKYKEKIFAAYVQASKTFFGFTLKPGVRLETTDIRGRQIIPGDTVFSITRTDVFPYVFLKHKLFSIFGFPLTGNAIYRRSIKRPYYEILNPYPRYVDQYLFDVGNPGLKPQFTTNYELNATYNEIPVFSVGINNTKDIYSNVTYQDNNTRIAYRTYDNLGNNKEFYFRLIGGLPPGGKYFFYAGTQYNYNRYKGLYQGQVLDFSRGSWVFFMFHELKATPTLTLNMQGFLRTKGLQNLYELKTFGGMFVSVNKAVFKKKLNIIVSVNDLLGTNRVSFQLNQADVNATGKRINDTRKLGVTLRYNFGLKAREEKKNSFEQPAESN